jgi:hypothetical protein
MFQDDDEDDTEDEKENSMPETQNFGRGRRSAVIDHKLRTGALSKAYLTLAKNIIQKGLIAFVFLLSMLSVVFMTSPKRDVRGYIFWVKSVYPEREKYYNFKHILTRPFKTRKLFQIRLRRRNGKSIRKS